MLAFLKEGVNYVLVGTSVARVPTGRPGGYRWGALTNETVRVHDRAPRWSRTTRRTLPVA